MKSIQFFKNPVFKAILTAFNQFKSNTKTHAFTSKRSQFIMTAIALSIAISYNSCGIHYSNLLGNKKAQNVAAADSVKADTIALASNDQKTIYLTFDDGPNRGTSKVMDVLEQAKVPATFFLVGSHIHGSDKQWAEYQAIMENPIFEAANHTYYHAKNQYARFYNNTEIALKDFGLMRDSLQLNCPVGRTPGCNTWRTSHISDDVDRRSRRAADLLQSNGYTLVGWDVEWKANGKQQLKNTAEELLNEIERTFAERKTHTDDHLVMLLHDQHFVDSSNVRALEDLVRMLKEKYALGKVSGYPCL